MQTVLIVVALFLCAGCIVLAFLYLESKKKIKRLTSWMDENSKMLAEAKEEVRKYRQQAEEPAQDRTQELEEIVREQSEMDFTLKRALKKSETASFHQNSFISSLSKEIRTPLNNIIGFSSLLEAEISILENKELFDYARAISESGDRLLAILNNLIDISKIESHDHQVSLKQEDINSIIAGAVQLFVLKATEKKLKLNFIPREIPHALADEKSLGKVLSIVIENAVKYTDNGFVNVSTDYLPDRNEVGIRIKDTGIGIDEAFQVDIFSAYRNESAGFTRETQGAGLGLPLAKSLVELMKGTIRLESRKGSGTTVSINLACETEPGGETDIGSTRERRIRALQDLEIFIVEDDLMNKMVLVQMTKGLGNVITAMNGDDTLKVMESQAKEGKFFDIMLFDINLPPPWDGIRLMKEIRSRWKEYKKIPFVAQTAYAMVGDKEKLLAEGFDDYISKPINQQELYTIMRNQLNKFRHE